MIKENRYLSSDDLPQLYRDYLREILAYLYRFLHNKDEAEETAQETFFHICERVKKGNLDNANIRAYIYRTAHNLAIDHLRKKNIIEENLDDERYFKNNNHDEQLIDSDIIDSIKYFVDHSLTSREQEAFRLRFYHELTIDEISDIIGISSASVSRVLSSVVSRLKKEFPDAI